MEEIEKLMGDYVALIGNDDTRLAAAFYEEPASIVGPKVFLLLLTKTDVVKFLDSLQLTARPLGYAKSTLEYLATRMLNSEMALCSAITARWRADGSEMQKVGATYLLRRGTEGWKIRQLMMTDLDKLL